MTKIIETTPNIDTENAAKLIKRLYEADGWSANIEKQEDGKFTVIATKEDGVSGERLISGAPPPPGNGINGLLDFIAKFESKGNYNAYFEHPNNQDNPRLTHRTLASVLAWQQDYVATTGAESAAAGRYQIIRGTLRDLIATLDLKIDVERFNQDLQDKMGRTLLKRRNWDDFIAGTLSVEEFSINVAKEWAALPVLKATRRGSTDINPGQSYYDGIGSNTARTTSAEFRAALVAAKDA